jgi:hypothetical protein
VIILAFEKSSKEIFSKDALVQQENTLNVKTYSFPSLSCGINMSTWPLFFKIFTYFLYSLLKGQING